MSDENKSKKKEKPEDGEKNVIIERLTEYRSEFRKIVWPSRELLFKHTLTTIVISLIFGVFIAILDGVFSFTFHSAVNWLLS